MLAAVPLVQDDSGRSPLERSAGFTFERDRARPEERCLLRKQRRARVVGAAHADPHPRRQRGTYGR